MYAGIPRGPIKYHKDDIDKIFELVKTLNMGGHTGATGVVDYAIKQYDYLKEKIKEANQDG